MFIMARLFVSFVFILLLILCDAQKCPSGNYLDKQTGLCKKCTPNCGGGQIEIHGCIANSDISCVCPDGKFYDHYIILCRPCIRCTDGQYEVQKCLHSHNRNCSACPSGYFVDNNKCEMCKQCSEGQTVLRKCTASNNTECGRQDAQSLTVDPPITTYKQDTSPIEHITKPSKTQHNYLKGVIYIMLAVVVVILLVLILFIAKKCCQTKQRMKTTTNQPYLDDTSDSKNDKSVLFTRDPGIMVRDMNPVVIEKLSKLLNPYNLINWRQMAARMNFSQLDIRNFEINKEESTQKVLEAYGTRKDSTVFNLYQIFLNMPRDDCATILEDVLILQC